jgi:hypothetical protein
LELVCFAGDRPVAFAGNCFSVCLLHCNKPFELA